MIKKTANIPTLDYRAAHIANFILEKAEKDGVAIDTLKLLKLVYIFFGWSSAFLDRYIFEDSIQAWKYGPVIPPLYHEFKHFGKDPIEEGFRASIFDPFDEDNPLEKPIIGDNKDKELFQTLDIIWNVYKDAPANHLVAMTHERGTPWWETYDGSRDKEIPKSRIYRYYKPLIK